MPTDTPAKLRMLKLPLGFADLQHSPLHLTHFLYATTCTNTLQHMRIGLPPPSQNKKTCCFGRSHLLGNYSAGNCNNHTQTGNCSNHPKLHKPHCTSWPGAATVMDNARTVLMTAVAPILDIIAQCKVAVNNSS